MRTITFFGVCLLALAVIGMCSAKRTRAAAQPPTDEQYCQDIVSILKQEYGYSGTAATLEAAYKNGRLKQELNTGTKKHL